MIRRLVICTLLVSGVVVAVAGLGIASAAARMSGVGTPNSSAKPSAAPPWSVQVTPKKLKAPGQALGISCSTPTSCEAVGYDQSVSGIDVPLAESWNGETWNVNATPTVLINFENFASDLEFTSVSCTSPTACEAVGWSNYSQIDPVVPNYSLAASWNGSSWALQQTPNVGNPADGENDLTSVSCVSRSLCIAAGWTIDPSTGSSNPTTMAEIWNGKTWSIEPTPALTGTSQFNGVICTSATECVAVGSLNGLPLAETWNGATWTVQTTPSPSGATSSSLASVSCSGAGSCNAVGSYSTTTSTAAFDENWDGTTWTVEAVPAPAGATSSSLSSVSCAGTSLTCTAVGTYSSGTGDLTLAQAWNGTAWSIQPSPDPSIDQSTSLAGIACFSGAACLAVGTGTDDGVSEPIFVSSAGDSWVPGEFHTPGFQAESLAGIACRSATRCQAVGTYAGQNLGEGYNGAAWNLETTPLEWIHGYVEVPSALYSGSCPSSSFCVAAGQTWTDGVAGLEGPFPDVATWNGSSWVTRQLQFETVGTMTGVSCPTKASCTAVGFSPQLGGALIEFWNGSKWKTQVPAVPRGGSMTNLESVSCLATGRCTAVGTYMTRAGATATLVEVRIGKTWTVQTTPLPSGAISSTLNGVSCTTMSACTAVGSYTAGGVTSALFENWNGASWTLQAAPASGPDSLNGVSCTAATACTAVGSDAGKPALIDTRNGSAWKTRSTALPYGGTSEVLNGVSCWAEPNGPECTAVGTFTDSEGIQQTLAVSTTDSPPFIKREPWNEYVNDDGTATFTAVGTGYPVPTFQWQVSTDGGSTWTPLSDGTLPDGSIVTGAETDTLEIAHVQSDESGNEYEVVFSNSVGSATSSAASLSVS